MTSLLLRCYPARWRARYGDEFEAILEERPLGPFDVADILLGALDAQLRLRRVGTDIAHGRGFTMSLRIGGIAAVLGGALWTLGLVMASGLVGDVTSVDSVAPFLLLIAGAVALLVALTGLSAFQARTHPRLTWAAFALPAAGSIACIVGLIGLTVVGEPYWYVWFFGTLTTFVGSALFAIATYRTAVLSRAAAVLLGIGSILLPVVLLSQDVGFLSGFEAVFVAAGLTFFALGWFALGVQAVRLDRPGTAPRPA